MSEGKAELLRVSGRFELSRVKLQHMNEAAQGNLILLFEASKKYNKSTLKGSLRGGPYVTPLNMGKIIEKIISKYGKGTEKDLMRLLFENF